MSRGELASWLTGLGLAPPARPWPESSGRFPDGRRYHFEIPSVEGPVVLRAVLEEARTSEVRVGAPVHVKTGLRNATSVYPSGLHLEPIAAIQAREKVRRAALLDRLIRELAPELAA